MYAAVSRPVFYSVGAAFDTKQPAAVHHPHRCPGHRIPESAPHIAGLHLQSREGIPVFAVAEPNIPST